MYESEQGKFVVGCVFSYVNKYIKKIVGVSIMPTIIEIKRA